PDSPGFSIPQDTENDTDSRSGSTTAINFAVRLGQRQGLLRDFRPRSLLLAASLSPRLHQ
ncbi:MAG: hypothetical protein ACOX62_06610, partial [Christensenellales bacterium]